MARRSSGSMRPNVLPRVHRRVRVASGLALRPAAGNGVSELNPKLSLGAKSCAHSRPYLPSRPPVAAARLYAAEK